jgi:hypothetical protein
MRSGHDLSYKPSWNLPGTEENMSHDTQSLDWIQTEYMPSPDSYPVTDKSL